MNTQTIGIKRAIGDLDSLPAMPIIARKLLALDLESVSGERDLLKLIEQDPQISAKIIGLANSPLFGASKRVTGLPDSAILLGLTRVKAVTMGIAVMTSLIKRPSGVLDTQKLWGHSLGVALAVRVLAQAMPRNTRPLDDEIFLGGLLHDIGYMVLNHLDQKISDELHTRIANEKELTVEQIEAELLVMSHSEMGAELARRWDLPESIVAVIRYHHTPEAEGADVGQPLVGLINLAEKIIAEYGCNIYTKQKIDEEEWHALGIDPARAAELESTVLEKLEESKNSGATFN